MHANTPISNRRTSNGPTTRYFSGDNSVFKPPDRSNWHNLYGRDRLRGGFSYRVRALERPVVRSPNFVVELRGVSGCMLDDEVSKVVELCESKPDGFRFCRKGDVVLELFFTEWMQALEGIVCMWKLRFDGFHNLTPVVVSELLLPSDVAELDGRLRDLFCERLEGYLKGPLVQRLEKRMESLADELACIFKKKFNKISVHTLLSKKRDGLNEERELIARRLREFRTAVECIICYLQEKKLGDGRVLKLDGHIDMGRLYQLISREVKRLEDGLPIYSFRQEILQIIKDHQV